MFIFTFLYGKLSERAYIILLTVVISGEGGSPQGRRQRARKTIPDKASFPSTSLCSTVLDASDWQNLGYMPTSKLQGDRM